MDEQTIQDNIESQKVNAGDVDLDQFLTDFDAVIAERKTATEVAPQTEDVPQPTPDPAPEQEQTPDPVPQPTQEPAPKKDADVEQPQPESEEAVEKTRYDVRDKEYRDIRKKEKIEEISKKLQEETEKDVPTVSEMMDDDPDLGREEALKIYDDNVAKAQSYDKKVLEIHLKNLEEDPQTRRDYSELDYNSPKFNAEINAAWEKLYKEYGGVRYDKRTGLVEAATSKYNLGKALVEIYNSAFQKGIETTGAKVVSNTANIRANVGAKYGRERNPSQNPPRPASVDEAFALGIDALMESDSDFS